MLKLMFYVNYTSIFKQPNQMSLWLKHWCLRVQAYQKKTEAVTIPRETLFHSKQQKRSCRVSYRVNRCLRESDGAASAPWELTFHWWPQWGRSEVRGMLFKQIHSSNEKWSWCIAKSYHGSNDNEWNTAKGNYIDKFQNIMSRERRQNTYQMVSFT